MRKLVANFLAVVAAFIFLVGPGILYSKPWVHRPTLNELAVEAGYTNVETISSNSERRSIVKARLGQCRVEIYRFKDELDPDKYEVWFRKDDEYFRLSDHVDVEKLAKTDETAAEWERFGQKHDWISPVFCDAYKPFNNSRWDLDS
jgi:hypothetical protein